jgi:hypothetical protein
MQLSRFVIHVKPLKGVISDENPFARSSLRRSGMFIAHRASSFAKLRRSDMYMPPLTGLGFV